MSPQYHPQQPDELSETEDSASGASGDLADTTPSYAYPPPQGEMAFGFRYPPVPDQFAYPPLPRDTASDFMYPPVPGQFAYPPLLGDPDRPSLPGGIEPQDYVNTPILPQHNDDDPTNSETHPPVPATFAIDPAILVTIPSTTNQMDQSHRRQSRPSTRRRSTVANLPAQTPDRSNDQRPKKPRRSGSLIDKAVRQLSYWRGLRETNGVRTNRVGPQAGSTVKNTCSICGYTARRVAHLKEHFPACASHKGNPNAACWDDNVAHKRGTEDWQERDFLQRLRAGETLSSQEESDLARLKDRKVVEYEAKVQGLESSKNQEEIVEEDREGGEEGQDEPIRPRKKARKVAPEAETGVEQQEAGTEGGPLEGGLTGFFIPPGPDQRPHSFEEMERVLGLASARSEAPSDRTEGPSSLQAENPAAQQQDRPRRRRRPEEWVYSSPKVDEGEENEDDGVMVGGIRRKRRQRK